MANPQPVGIDEDAMYRVTFSAAFVFEGRKFIPRAGVSLRLKGSIVAAVKEKLDSYEVD